MYFKSLNTAKGSPLNAKITIITLSNDLSLYSKKYYTKYFKKCSKKYFKKKSTCKTNKGSSSRFSASSSPFSSRFPPKPTQSKISHRFRPSCTMAPCGETDHLIT